MAQQPWGEPRRTRPFHRSTKLWVIAFRGLAAWILEHAPHVAPEQEHLAEGTRESVYWHYGYLTALLDVRESLARRRSSLH